MRHICPATPRHVYIQHIHCALLGSAAAFQVASLSTARGAALWVTHCIRSAAAAAEDAQKRQEHRHRQATWAVPGSVLEVDVRSERYKPQMMR